MIVKLLIRWTQSKMDDEKRKATIYPLLKHYETTDDGLSLISNLVATNRACTESPNVNNLNSSIDATRNVDMLGIDKEWEHYPLPKK